MSGIIYAIKINRDKEMENEGTKVFLFYLGG